MNRRISLPLPLLLLLLSTSVSVSVSVSVASASTSTSTATSSKSLLTSRGIRGGLKGLRLDPEVSGRVVWFVVVVHCIYLLQVVHCVQIPSVCLTKYFAYYYYLRKTGALSSPMPTLSISYFTERLPQRQPQPQNPQRRRQSR